MTVLFPVTTPKRYIFAVLAAVICLHYVLTIAYDDYGRISSFSNISERTGERHGNDALSILDYNNLQSHPNITGPRANATFVLLARNSDLAGVINSMQSAEDRFNRYYNYPWVLLNEEPFTDEFKERVSVLTRAPIYFGLIPKEHWFQPEWIDEDRARAGRQKMMAQRIIYGGSVPYRNMCRFNSGFFFQHELLQPYRPDVRFFCDLDYDPFLYMQEHDKVYSFTISLFEWEPTIPTLWQTVKDFIAEFPHNFEIADMNFWRSEAYIAFFEYLETKGGFYYERWGDAPVHSIAAALFARRDQIHFFRDIGYKHEPFQHCPSGNNGVKGVVRATRKIPLITHKIHV
ncbi:glycosyltransferase family 15 protein [Lentinula guzmanii]|uniref:Glycosyltransferase family 15 protein n=1 Tax=Lentinula guzmanii TaxID=2804957 RepID=A0AA38JM67_9AGAR|nr:glycosyltransferase family 15 protein [Lentinula guzmanii]